MMPDMDGFEFISHIKRHEDWRQIPVIVITAKVITAEDRWRLNGAVARLIERDCKSPIALAQMLSDVLTDVSKKTTHA